MIEPSVGVSVSIVLVAYRQREVLDECLRSCTKAAERVPGGAELIVVDNGELAGFIRERAPHARVIEPGHNLGFAGGVSRGMVEAKGEWVALVNDDARIEPDSLAKLLAAGGRADHIGSVAAQVRFHADPGRVNSAGIEVDSLGVATERLAGRPVGEAGEAGEVFGASGCVALYRMAMLRELGGLDERFFAYLEDVDLAWRARAAGWSCVYEPGALAYHHGSASSGEGSSRKYFLVGRNHVRLLARNATTAQLLRALPGIVLYDSAYVLYAAATDRTLAPLRGRIAGLREWRAARHETRDSRQAVKLSPARHGWMAALRQHRAYLTLGSSS
jgi:GT2 family glycosyltransferase